VIADKVPYVKLRFKLKFSVPSKIDRKFAFLSKMACDLAHLHNCRWCFNCVTTELRTWLALALTRMLMI